VERAEEDEMTTENTATFSPIMEIRTPTKTITFGADKESGVYTLVIIAPGGVVTEDFDMLQSALLFIAVVIGEETAVLK
jgi:hypothetical protein